MFFVGRDEVSFVLLKDRSVDSVQLCNHLLHLIVSHNDLLHVLVIVLAKSILDETNSCLLW